VGGQSALERHIEIAVYRLELRGSLRVLGKLGRHRAVDGRGPARTANARERDRAGDVVDLERAGGGDDLDGAAVDGTQPQLCVERNAHVEIEGHLGARLRPAP